jgi:hypothetical protein
MLDAYWDKNIDGWLVMRLVLDETHKNCAFAFACLQLITCKDVYFTTYRADRNSLLNIVLICPVKVLYNFEISFETILSQQI